MPITFFVNNAAGFVAAAAAAGHVLLGTETFEESNLAPGQISPGFPDPLAPGVANTNFPTGTTVAFGVTVQGNTNGDNPANLAPGGLGTTNLVTASAGYLGTPDDQVSTNDAAGAASFDILIDPPGAAPVKAVGLVPLYYDVSVALSPTDTLNIRVYNTANVLIGTTTLVGGNYITEASFVGIVATGADVIGRINVADGTASMLDFVGADDIQVFVGNIPAVAVNDAFATNEATAIGAGLNVFNANPTTPDSDPESDPFSVTAVQGNVANLGMQTALASGALVTLNANGTFSYNPNGAFNATPAAGSGASNTTASDSFTYTITGGSTATVTINIAGVDSNDILLGTAGADTLTGGIGNDDMSGLAASDIFYVADTTDRIFEVVGQGVNDRAIVTANSWTLGAGQEVERIVGNLATGQTLTGNDLSNYIYGGAGNDTLDGGAGADTIAGGAGNDAYLVDHSGDRVYEAVGGGGDTVIASVNYALVAGQEIETLQTGVAGLTLIGNELDNHIIGSTGTERLYGGLGNDQLDGGAGGDYLIGQGGDDTFLVDSAGDVVIEAVGGGADTVNASINYALAAGAEIEFLAADSAAGLVLSGNGFDNTIFGGAGVDYLYGQAGNDTIFGRGGSDAAIGGAGNDTFAFFASEFAAGEIDQVFGFNDAAGDNDILRLQGDASAYSFQDVGGDVIATHLASGGTIQLFGFSQARLADQVVYFV